MQYHYVIIKCYARRNAGLCCNTKMVFIVHHNTKISRYVFQLRPIDRNSLKYKPFLQSQLPTEVGPNVTFMSQQHNHLHKNTFYLLGPTPQTNLHIDQYAYR